jgi:hypothetical protein
MKSRIIPVIVCCLLLLAPAAHAVILGGPEWSAEFDGSSFADAVSEYDFTHGSFFAGGPGSILNQELLNDGWLYLMPDDTITVEFMDNVVVNGHGYDLVIFEWGLPEEVGVSFPLRNGKRMTDELVHASFATGSELLNVTLVDLSDFGFDPGESVRSVRLRGVGPTIYEPAGLAAINNRTLGQVDLSLLEFFDQAVSSGVLYGSGPGSSAQHRLDAIRNMVTTGQAHLDREKYQQGGNILLSAFYRTDGEDGPEDFITGPAAPEFAARIWNVISVINFR